MFTTTIFKNGGCDCWISSNIKYLKVEHSCNPEKKVFYVKQFLRYRKASFLLWITAVLNIARNGGSIKISGCFHNNYETVSHQGHLCQISCFCPAVKMCGLNSPQYEKQSSNDSFNCHIKFYLSVWQYSGST